MERKEFLDKYGYYILTILSTIKFGITSTIWITSSPLLNTYFKISSILSIVVTPLIPIFLQAIIEGITRQHKMYDQKTKDLLKFLIFIYNFPLFGMSLLMIFLEFNLVSYNLIRLLALPITLPYAIILLRVYFRNRFKLISIIYSTIYIIGFISSFFLVEIHLREWFVDVSILIVICIVLLSMYYIESRKKKKS